MNNKHKHFSFFNILLIALLTLSLVSLVSSDFQLDTSVFDRFLKNDQVNSDKNTENSEPLVKQLYCQYDGSISFENSVGGLRIYVPTYEGYINYNIVHTQNQNDYKDVWRIGQAYALDDNLQNSYAITPAGAEWDMALMLSGRPDFIGGHAHGDEIYTSISMFLDGKQVGITSVKDLTAFEEIVIIESSYGYDPNDHTTKVLEHYKEYIINENGITLNQKVEWLNDYTLSSSYMAMMPPLKTLTDTFYTDVDYTLISTNGNYGYILDAKKAVVYGSISNLKFTMSVPKYPSLAGGDRFLLTDNSGGAYNKMYFVICNGASVSAGDIWETTTCYSLHGLLRLSYRFVGLAEPLHATVKAPT